MENNRHISGAEYQNNYDGIDTDKTLAVLKKSILWIVVIFALTNLSAYLFIRWTKPVYQSESDLKLDVKSDATELGIAGISDDKNLNVISGEIELIKSKLFFNKVIEALDLDINYYTAGNVLNDEKFTTAPFTVSYHLKNTALYDQRINIRIIDGNTYAIVFDEDAKPLIYTFGKRIETPAIDFTINLTRYYEPKGDKDFFFIINSKESLINYLEKNLTVEPLNLNANTIRIAFKDNNPSKAQNLVNAIDTLYLKYSEQEKSKENKQKIQWLNQELKQIENELERYENYFEDFTIKNRTSDLGSDLKKTIDAINLLDSQRYEITKKTKSTAHLLKKLSNTSYIDIYETDLQYFPAHVIKTIDELNTLIKKRDELKLSYSESTYALSKIEQETSYVERALKKQLMSMNEVYKTKLYDLRYQKQKLENSFAGIPEKTTEYNKNQRFFNLYEDFYLSLMQNKAQFEIAQAGTTTDFKILSPATNPKEPIFPNKLIIYGIGIVCGFFLSFFMVTIRYLLHNKITTTNELEKLSSAPILGAVPTLKDRMRESKLIIHSHPKSAVGEALRSIRTNIQFMTKKGNGVIISVTSTVGGEGKTFISVNLGGIIALSKKKVVLLDLDMRKPRVHLSFNDDVADKGISTILINKHKISECLRKTPIEGFDYIPAGPTPPNPSELLLNGEFENLLAELKNHYDTIILDTPPVGLVTDGILAMKKADLSLYIARSNYSKKAYMKTLNRLIDVNQFKNIAVVLNATDTLGSNTYGYGYYEENGLSESIVKKLFKDRV